MILSERYLGDHQGYSLLTRFPVLKKTRKGYVELTMLEISYTNLSSEFYRRGWFQDMIEEGLYLIQGDYYHIVKYSATGDIIVGEAVQVVPKSTKRYTATLRNLW